MRKRIEVTKEDIAKGKRLRGDACPLAKAMDRALNRDVIVGVCEWRWLSDPAIRGSYRKLSKSAMLFRARFDSELPVEPFHFFVEV